MGLRFTLEFYGDKQIDRTLEGIQDRVTDAEALWDALADDFVMLERAQFATEGRTGSGGWQPLSPAYAAWKQKNYPGTKILERTGALKESLTQRPLGVEQFTGDSMVIGSDVPYGRFHQNGDGVPVRKPVELIETDRRRWVKYIQQYVKTGDLPGGI